MDYCRLLQCSLLCSLLLHKNHSPESDKIDKLTYFLFPEELGNLNLPLIKEPLDPIEKKPPLDQYLVLLSGVIVSLPFLDVLAVPFFIWKRIYAILV